LARATFDIPTFQQATTKWWQVLIVVTTASSGAGYRVTRINKKKVFTIISI
jgi:hypothetical protein